MKALVSIITPTFNSEKFIAQTIASVQNQSFRQWEMILVDDCSSDATVSIIKRFIGSDDRITIFQLEKNSGPGIARNLGLQKASGQYIAFLDSDDLWKPEKLQKQLDFMKLRGLPFTFSFYECINEEGKEIGKSIEAPQKLSYRQLFFCNYVGNLTGIYDSGFFGKIEIASVRKRQDWIIWLKILKQIKTAMPVPESLAFYRIRENSVSSSKMKLLKHNFKIYRNVHRLNFLTSVLCMIIFLFTQMLIKPLYSKRIKPTT
jgi:teichuronic acid biosynthesis glycosyltransferase TuaG